MRILDEIKAVFGFIAEARQANIGIPLGAYLESLEGEDVEDTNG